MSTLVTVSIAIGTTVVTNILLNAKSLFENVAFLKRKFYKDEQFDGCWSDGEYVCNSGDLGLSVQGWKLHIQAKNGELSGYVEQYCGTESLLLEGKVKGIKKDRAECHLFTFREGKTLRYLCFDLVRERNVITLMPEDEKILPKLVFVRLEQEKNA